MRDDVEANVERVADSYCAAEQRERHDAEVALHNLHRPGDVERIGLVLDPDFRFDRPRRFVEGHGRLDAAATDCRQSAQPHGDPGIVVDVEDLSSMFARVP